MLNNAGINNNGNDGRIVKIKTDSSPMMIESITIGDIEYTRDGDGVSKNSVDWEIYRYYIYKNGVYYKLADACEIVNSPVQAHIDTSNFTQGDYIIHDGYIYVRGQYDDKNSSYNNYENDVNNNLVEKPDGTFSSNGKPWGEGVTAGLSPDVTQAQVFKLVSSTYGYDENDNVLIYKYTNDKQEEITVEYHLGYSYMRDAYYTAKATPNNIDIATKIAKFTWTTDKPNDYSEDTEGIDYIQVNYEETVIGEDGSQTVEPRTGYYVIDSVVEDSDGNQIYSYGQTLPHNGNDIYIYIYPYSFTNPYNKQIDNINVQDSNFYTIDSAETAVQISHTPTYYYYDGGYVTNGSSVYELIPDKYLGSGDSSLSITIYNEAGESEEITLNDLKEDYATYSDWYIVDTSFGDYSNLTDKSLYTVGYNYYVKNGKLYTLSTTYSIQDGVCVVSQMITNTDDNKQILYNYNKYLTDEEIGLYTRYIYTGRLLMPQSITTDNLFEEEGNNGRYYTFPKNNNGRLYRLTESVCVSVGGSANLRFCETGNNTIIDQIIVDAGGVKVL